MYATVRHVVHDTEVASQRGAASAGGGSGIVDATTQARAASSARARSTARSDTWANAASVNAAAPLAVLPAEDRDAE
ncbi:hypothetical protein [Gemmatimonas sp.]|uniref:hypothetical protein n=1 Tax=Gemmatimonas sp. TaxID=1962908 RepID=UPI003F71AC4C